MIGDFLIQHHPWKLLKEGLTAPTSEQITVLKKVMDGESLKGPEKDTFKSGMKAVGLKTLHELILWGLRSGIIHDKPLHIADDVKEKGSEYYPMWLRILNYTVSGYSDADIEREGRISKDSINYYKKLINDKFNLGNSSAKFIRFAFQVLNPISGPSTIRGFKPFTPSTLKYGSLKYPPVHTTFKPAERDPDINYNYQSVTGKGRSGSIKIALWMLGVDKSALGKTQFWSQKPETLWHILELAKTRYDREIAHAHPDKGGDVRRAAQLNTAWKFVKEMFKRRGYELRSV